MENTTTMSAAAVPMDTASTDAKTVAKKKEHWLVEVVGGLTLVTTMISALSLWYVFLAYVLPISA
ncbi:MAG: hypothetical protein AAB619_00705 [Patescibacteria group bacterium]